MKIIEQFNRDELITIFDVARVTLAQDASMPADELNLNGDYFSDLGKLITIFEAARVTLAQDASMLADELGVNEDYLSDLGKKLEKETWTEQKNLMIKLYSLLSLMRKAPYSSGKPLNN